MVTLMVNRTTRGSGAAVLVAIAALGVGSIARAQNDARDARDARDAAVQPDLRAPFSFAVVRTATADGDRATTSILHATDDGPSRFVVHFEGTAPSPASCTDGAIDRRRALLDTSTKPVVPIVATSQWADCGAARSDPVERLERSADVLFGGDQSLGLTGLSWLRQSAVPRFTRYPENLRWQSGLVLFATLNLPDNNNDYRSGAGRNGEFEERLVADRAWLERTFRLANERRLRGVVLFVDAAPRFTMPLRAPDNRLRERDGYYEFKIALREFVASFKGQVLLVQGHRGPAAPATSEPDHPLRDPAGKPLENLTRVAMPSAADEGQWLRIEVDPANRVLFRVVAERVFDDPSGELYGTPPSR